MNPLRLPALFAFIALLPALQAKNLSFDARAEQVAAGWIRGDPNAATRAQFFAGDEQDALDRQLKPVTKAFSPTRSSGPMPCSTSGPRLPAS